MNSVFRRLLATKLVRSADRILVTGDVADTGSLAEWRVFWAEVKRNGLAKRVVVLPGNHDVCCLGARPHQRRRERSRSDAKRVRQGLEMGGQPTAFPWAEQLGDDLVLFGLDSCHAGNTTAITNAQGELGLEQLERFARLLKRHHDVPIKIVALHHSPNIPAAVTEKRRGLPATSAVSRWGHEVPPIDRRALRLLCVSHGVRLIVHGHLHRAEDRRVSGVRIIGAPASTQPMPGTSNRFELFSYTVKGKRVTTRLHNVTC